MEIDSSGHFHDYCEDCNRFRKVVDYPDYRCRECFLKLMREQHDLFLWTVDDWQTWCKANNEPMPRFEDGKVLEESQARPEFGFTQRDSEHPFQQYADDNGMSLSDFMDSLGD
jgi:hypothetical protein